MTLSTRHHAALRSRFLETVSTVILGSVLLTGTAFAQDTAPDASATPLPAPAEEVVEAAAEPIADVTDEIVVEGIRSSLESAIATKRKADNILDGISAEGIGRFPDLNLAESLQRISGVQIVRDDFRSGQVAIRGLTGFSKTQVNGQDLASPNFGGAFVYGIFESSVLSGVDVMKTPHVRMDTGGIAGLVNLKTRKALDFKDDRHLFVNVKAQHEELNGAWMPDLGLSAGFKNEAGDFGAFISVGYQEKDFRSDSAKITEYQAIDANTFIPPSFGDGSGSASSGDSRIVSQGRFDAGLSRSQLDALGGDLSSVIFVPKRARYTSRGTTGDRISIAGGAGWEASDELSFNLTGIFAQDHSEQPLNTISLMTFGTRGFLFDILETQDEGTFGTTATSIRVHSPQMQVQERIRDRDFQTWSTTLDMDYLNGPWDIHAAVHVTEGETQQSQHQIVSRIENRSGASGNRFLDNGLVATLNTGAGDPYGFGFTLNQPFSDIATFGWDRTNANGGADTSDELFAGIFTGGTNNYDRFEDQVAAQIDIKREVDLPFISSFEVGTKFKSVGQENQLKGFRSIFNTNGANVYDISAWDNSLFHDSFLDDGSGFFGGDVAFTGLQVPNAREAIAALSVLPGALRNTDTAVDLIDEETGLVYNSVGGGVYNNTRDVFALYASANFEQDLGPIGLRGNVGVRYVDTSREAKTSTQTRIRPPGGTSADDVTTRVDIATTTDFDHVLPQINLIFDVTEDLTFRTSYSETLNNLNPEKIRAGNSVTARDSGGDYTISQFSDRSHLLPNTAKSYDIAVEWYNRAGSTVHGAIFTKEIENFVEIVFDCPATIPGVEGLISGTPAFNGVGSSNGGLGDCVDDAGTIIKAQLRSNAEGSFRISGAELGATQNLDFLDGFWSNIGVTANYTYLYKHSINADANRNTNDTFGAQNENELSLSPHSFNFIPYYETDKFGVRLAGNYRHHFIDSRTLGGFLGADRIVDDRIQWDFSGSYNVSENFKLGAEVINIFDEDRYEYQGTERRHRNLFSEGRTWTVSGSYEF